MSMQGGSPPISEPRGMRELLSCADGQAADIFELNRFCIQILCAVWRGLYCVCVRYPLEERFCFKWRCLPRASATQTHSPFVLYECDNPIIRTCYRHTGNKGGISEELCQCLSIVSPRIATVHFCICLTTITLDGPRETFGLILSTESDS